MELLIGMRGKGERIVTNEVTAAACGSGLLPVFSTPSLVALMEMAACNAIEKALPEEQTSVGTRIDVRHESATPLGMRVWAEATLAAVDRRALSFTIEAFDETGRIGSATHDRFIVDAVRFLQKIEAKKP